MLCGPKNLPRYPDTILRLDLRVLRLEFFFILLKDSDDRAARQRCSQEKVFWKYRAKFTGEQPSRNEISLKLLCSFIEIALCHECSPVNLLHIFRTRFYKNTSGGLLLRSESSCILPHVFWFITRTILSRFKCFYSGVQIFLRFMVVFAKTFDIRFIEQAKKFIKLILS